MLHLNVLKSRAHWVEKNELTAEQADEVFKDLLPEGHGKDGQPEYGEFVVDLAIQQMRLKLQREAVEKKAAEGSPVYQTLVMLMEGKREMMERAGDEPDTVGVAYVAKRLGISRGTARNRANLPQDEGGFPPKMLAGKTSENGHHRFYKAEVDAHAYRHAGASAVDAAVDSDQPDPSRP